MKKYSWIELICLRFIVVGLICIFIKICWFDFYSNKGGINWKDLLADFSVIAILLSNYLIIVKKVMVYIDTLEREKKGLINLLEEKRKERDKLKKL